MIETRNPDSQAQREARLLADLRSRRPSALATIIAHFGSEMTGIAYLVLQHHDGAADAVAGAIAEVWRHADDPNTAPDIERLRVALLGATARQALLGHGTSRLVDPTTDSALGDLVTGLSPLARAAYGLRVVASLDDDTIAVVLERPARKIRRVLESAVGGAAPSTAIVRRLTSLTVTVDPERVRAAMARPTDAPGSRRWWVAAASALALGLVLFRLAVTADEQPAAGDPGPPARSDVGAMSHPPTNTLGTDSLWSRFWPGRVAVPAFTLADCDIEPVGSPIAFAGWVTVEQIRATGIAPAGRSVYAIVTRGEAEWIGYRYTHDRPVFPRPVGRMGCVFDPGSERHVAIGVAQDWEPPALADGCPASPMSSFAGYLELGGPGAFVLMDVGRTWRAEDPGLSFLVRVAPSLPAGARLEAWLQPVGDGSGIATTVGSPRAEEVGSVMHYIRVGGVEVPEPGCWTMNVAVDGTVVGSAVLPIWARMTPAS